ncbi:HEPN domain-containing protein [Salinimonas sediminis]|uniref:Uncharacterized protein n=1 Tax=Salinimonas sediminis TaxID=2303538 RepID=A0A346NRV4_9ALTE|nr:HEPN domain-containing protein [Salinimonas sediminis]AXR08261.1 hypothetical protein D0Y50_19010 [Salinimonas sediminis]
MFFFNEKEIEYKDIKFKYEIRYGDVSDKVQKYFYIAISCSKAYVEEYKQLLKIVRGACKSDSFDVETLTSDLSHYSACNAYGKIHEIENLMRRLITFFMVTKVGKDWAKNNSPDAVKKNFARDRSNNGHEYASELHKLDFGHLADFLFKSYQTKTNESLYTEINSLSDSEQVNIEKLKSFIPTSNWNIFFKDSINVEASYLKSRWEKLTDLRNRVAHSADFTEEEYDEVEEIFDELKPILNDAFDQSVKLKIESDEREKIVSNLDSKIGGLFREIELCERYIRNSAGDTRNTPIENVINNLSGSPDIQKKTLNSFIELVNLKAKLTAETSPSDENINELENRVLDFKEQINHTWNDEVYNIVKGLGGKATLNEIYIEVRKTSKRTLYSAWKTSVRRAIYTNSSDVELFGGKYDIYKKVNKGTWKIRENIEESILSDFLKSN